MLDSGVAAQPRQTLAGIRQIGIRLGKTETQKVVATTALEKSVSRNTGDTGEPQQVHCLLDAGGARHHRGIRQYVVSAGGNTGLQTGYAKCSTNHLALELIV